MSGQVTMVFGGSRRIGAAIARRLAADGFDVALTYVSRTDSATDVVSAMVKGIALDLAPCRITVNNVQPARPRPT